MGLYLMTVKYSLYAGEHMYYNAYITVIKELTNLRVMELQL